MKINDEKSLSEIYGGKKEKKEKNKITGHVIAF